MQNNVEHVEENTKEAEGLIKTPRQLIITVVLAFIIPVIAIILLVKLVSFTSPMGAGSTAQSTDSIAERIQPVARFVIAGTDENADSNAPAKTGEQVYQATCAACHSSGVAGAPILGNNENWAPLIETGFAEMLRIALEGKGAMPPKGGNTSLSDFEVARAVTYMANESGASFDEPSEDADTAAAEDTKQDTSAEEPVSESAPASQEPGNADEKAEVDQAKTDEEAPAAEAETEAEAPAAKAEQSASAPAELDPAGEKLYSTACFICHTAGVAGAPKLGNAADWAPYVETGIDTMLEKSITGVGLMPPRGGSAATDEELKAAIEYILSTLE